MAIPRPALEARLDALVAEGDRVVLLAGPRGAGKTTLLRRLRARSARRRPTALVEIEPIAASPEMLFAAFREAAAPVVSGAGTNGGTAFRRLVGLVATRRADGALLVDEVTELRTLAAFRGVRAPLESFLRALARPARPRAVATTRYPYWARRFVEALPGAVRRRVAIVAVPPVDPAELAAAGWPDAAEELVRSTGGLALHLAPLLARLEAGASLLDAVDAELAPGGRIETECRATLAELLHRARGYGACKAVLRALAEEEGRNLTAVARRIERTPGATRDYLRWLEEVGLVEARDKRYSFVDPMLRLWLRLYGRAVPLDEAGRRRAIAAWLEGAAAVPPAERPASPRAAETDDELIEID